MELVRSERDASKKAEGERVSKQRTLTSKAPAAQTGTRSTLRETEDVRPAVIENFLMANSSDEGEDSVFAGPLVSKSVSCSKSSSGSDTED